MKIRDALKARFFGKKPYLVLLALLSATREATLLLHVTEVHSVEAT